MHTKYDENLTLEFYQAIFFKDVDKFNHLSTNDKVDIYCEKFLNIPFIVSKKEFFLFYLNKRNERFIKDNIMYYLIQEGNIELLKIVVEDYNIQFLGEHFGYAINVSIEQDNQELLEFFLLHGKEYLPMFNFDNFFIDCLKKSSSNTLKIIYDILNNKNFKIFCFDIVFKNYSIKENRRKKEEILLFLWNKLKDKSELKKHNKDFYNHIIASKKKLNVQGF